MFSPSDSDSDTGPTVSRFVPSSSKLPQGSDASPSKVLHPSKTSPVKQSPADQPDSLDAFMNTLRSSDNTPRQCIKSFATNLHKSSDDEHISEFVPAISSPEPEGHSPEKSSSLSLPPIDFKANPPLPVKRLTLNMEAQAASNAESGASHVKSLCASVRNGSLFPVTSFQMLSPPTPVALTDALSNMFPSPTPIQAISFPYMFSSRDVVGIAHTGSGKTIAYTLPLITHVSVQSGSSRSGRGPAGLIMAPTRELALQISQVVDRLGDFVEVSSCCVVGGVPKFEQYKQIRDGGAGIIVCTPGRLIDMLRMRACQMSRCSFVVIDEADRMLDMGFDSQVRTLLSQIRPDAQRALFSATFPGSVSHLVSDILNDPVTISMTGSGTPSSGYVPTMVNDNVKDTFLSFSDDNSRCAWLVTHLPTFIQEGLVIVFCATRGDAALTANVIRKNGFPAFCTHGETEQTDREELLQMFRVGEVPILVTTDMSARGLDIDDVRNVVNYGCAKSWEWHVHRVGRTGRACRVGNAYTLINRSSPTDISFSVEAVNLLRREKRNVPATLVEIAQLDQKETKHAHRHGRGRGRHRRKF